MFLDQQEVPALLSHHVPPVDTLSVALREVVVVDHPYFIEELLYSSKGAKVRGVTEKVGALSKHLAETRVWQRNGSSDKERPNKSAVESIDACRNLVHSLAKCAHKVDK